MFYFGTQLNSAGHHLWELHREDMYSSRFRLENLPFNPEGLPYESGKTYLKDGTVQFHQFCGFTIMAIAGSCHDQRPGSKSIFFVPELIDYKTMQERMLNIPIAGRIIRKMPFTLDWQ